MSFPRPKTFVMLESQSGGVILCHWKRIIYGRSTPAMGEAEPDGLPYTWFALAGDGHDAEQAPVYKSRESVESIAMQIERAQNEERMR